MLPLTPEKGLQADTRSEPTPWAPVSEGLKPLPALALLYFAVYKALPRIVRTHGFGPNFQEKKSFILIV